MTGVLVEKVALLDRKFAIGRSEMMRDRLVGVMVLAAVLASSSPAMAQAGLNNNMYNKLKESGPGGPAPKRDFSGSWAGPVTAQKGDDPSLTPEGQKLFSMNKPEAKFHVAGTNDAFVRTCDPLGFPRNIIFEIRGLSFAAMSDRVIILQSIPAGLARNLDRRARAAKKCGRHDKRRARPAVLRIFGGPLGGRRYICR